MFLLIALLGWWHLIFQMVLSRFMRLPLQWLGGSFSEHIFPVSLHQLYEYIYIWNCEFYTFRNTHLLFYNTNFPKRTTSRIYIVLPSRKRTHCTPSRVMPLIQNNWGYLTMSTGKSVLKLFMDCCFDVISPLFFSFITTIHQFSRASFVGSTPLDAYQLCIYTKSLVIYPRPNVVPLFRFRTQCPLNGHHTFHGESLK